MDPNPDPVARARVGRRPSSRQAQTAPARMRRVPAVIAVAAGLTTLVACSGSSSQSVGRQVGPAPSGSSAPSAAADGLHTVDVAVASGASAGAAAGQRLQVPSGWRIDVWAAVTSARMQAWTGDGRLLVTTDRAGTVEMLTLGSDTAHAPRVSTLVSGLDRPQGIGLAQVGTRQVLVVGEQTRIDAWDYAAGKLSNRRVVVDGLPGGGLHYGKFVTVRGSTVYFTIGSMDDLDVASRTDGRAVIEQVDLDGSGRRVLAKGVRNGEGLAVAPDGTLFTAVNQVNDPTAPAGQDAQSWTLDHPADQITRVRAGSDLGWPYCLPSGNAAHASTNVPYAAESSTNPGGTRLDCASLPPSQIGLPAHSAPIGFHFLQGSTLPPAWRAGALVVTHGSFQSQPPRPPGVYRLAWNATTKTLERPVPLIVGFQLSSGERWGRSVDAVAGPDGALYISDDQAGLVYRLHR